MPADRRRARQEALVRALEAEGLDALLVTALPNVRYLTGFSGSAALVVVTKADTLLVTDFRYDEQAAAEAGAVARVVVERSSAWDRLFRELAGLGGGTLESIGYEAHALTVKDAERLGAAGGGGGGGGAGAGGPGGGARPASSSSGCGRARTRKRSPRSERRRGWLSRPWARRSRPCAWG